MDKEISSMCGSAKRVARYICISVFICQMIVWSGILTAILALGGNLTSVNLAVKLALIFGSIVGVGTTLGTQAFYKHLPKG